MAVRSEVRTVGSILLEAARVAPAATALVVPPHRLDYQSLLDRAAGVARTLAAAGVEAGDRVGLLLPNGVQFVQTFFGIALLGAVPVPINPRLTAPEVAYITAHAGTRLVIAVETRREGPDGADAPPCPSSFSVEPTSDVGSTENVSSGRAQSPADDAVLLYTSGTTSKPKGVRLSHGAVLSTGIARFAERSDGEAAVVWKPCPLFHVGALVPLIGCVALRIPFVTQTGFDAGEALRLWEEERVTTALPLFPAFTDAILDHPTFARTDRSHLRQVLTTGQPQQVRRAQQALRPARIVSAYGMTELCGVAASSPLDESDEDRRAWDGRPLPAGELGEIAARGICRLTAYHRDPQATAAAIDADGWFHTGDLGVADPSGRIAFRGRGRDMLKVGGENVSPLEVEAHIGLHPAVAHVEVVGAPHPRLDEAVAAFVELHPGRRVTEVELIEHCRGALAHFKVPRHVRFVEPGDWPVSATKVSKAELREQIAAELLTSKGTP